MSIPPTVTRTTKDGLIITSSVDRCIYTIKELSRAALRDVGKFVCIKSNMAAQKLFYGSLGNGKSKRAKGLKKNAFQYWARKRECDLQVAVTHETWYGIRQELGTNKMKKKGILTNAVYENIPDIVKIESQYLSALEDEAKALSLISEKDYRSEDEEE